MSIEGQLNISLETTQNRVHQVHITSTRPEHACKLFHGKTRHETQKTLPLLFSVCGTAQAFASAQACEQALGFVVTKECQALRASLVRMETLREHFWRILLDWTSFLDEQKQQPDMTAILSLQAEHRQILTGGHDPFLQPEAIGFTPDKDLLQALLFKIKIILQQQVFGITPANWLALNQLEQLRKWASQQHTIAARMLNHVLQLQWESTGHNEIQPLPAMQASNLNSLMNDDHYVTQPSWFESCHETSSFTRMDSMLLHTLRSHYGNGLLVRLTARLTEMAQLSMQLLPMTEAENINIDKCNIGSIQNPGIGQVEAARGHLVHRVHLEGETVLNYQIVSPTAWNFHPQGVVAQSLLSLQGNRWQIDQKARLLIDAIDPCVAFNLSIN